MKVKKLIEMLNELDQELEITVLEKIPNRPYGGGSMKPIHEVTIVYDQDTNIPQYVIK